MPEAFATLKEAIGKYGFMDEVEGKPQVYLVIGRCKYWAYETVLNREDVQLTLCPPGEARIESGW